MGKQAPSFTSSLEAIKRIYKDYEKDIDPEDPETINNETSRKVMYECGEILKRVAFIHAPDSKEHTIELNKLDGISIYCHNRRIEGLLKGLTFYFTVIKKKAPKKTVGRPKKKKAVPKKKNKITIQNFTTNADGVAVPGSPQLDSMDTDEVQLFDDDDEATQATQAVFQEVEMDLVEAAEAAINSDPFPTIRKVSLYDHWSEVENHFTASGIVFDPQVVDKRYYFENEEVNSNRINIFPGYANSLDHYRKVYQNRTKDQEKALELMLYWIKYGLLGGRTIFENMPKDPLIVRWEQYQNLVKKIEQFELDPDPAIDIEDLKIKYEAESLYFDYYKLEELKKKNALMQSHSDMKEIDTNFEFFMNLLYFMIRFPWLKSKIFTVMFGPQGCGKSYFWLKFAKALYGEESSLYACFNDTDQIFGRFASEQLMTCLLAHIDEAYIHSSHAQKLKNNVTEKTGVRDMKYKAIETQKQFYNIVLTCNPKEYTDLIVFLDHDDRRTVVYEAANIFDTPEEMYFQMDLFDEYNTWELLIGSILDNKTIRRTVKKDWNAQAARPVTRFFVAQKTSSFTDVQKWWYNCLIRGQIYRFNTDEEHNRNITSLGAREPYTAAWFREVKAELLFAEYIKEFKHSSQANNAFNFNSIFPSVIGLQKSDYNMMLLDPNTPNVVKLPTLQKCKEIFVDKMKIPPQLLGISTAPKKPRLNRTQTSEQWLDTLHGGLTRQFLRFNSSVN